MRLIKSYLKQTWIGLFLHNLLISCKGKTTAYDLHCELRMHGIRKAHRDRWSKKKVAFYPGFPCFGFSLYKILRVLGCRMTNAMDPSADLLVRWELNTYMQPMSAVPQGMRTINAACLDISKEHVDLVFHEVFGYRSFVNPQDFEGLCVKKSNSNATHDGQIIECPSKENEEGYVYQKLIDNQIDDEFVLDVRVPVIGQDIPCVLYKYRRLIDRFNHIDKAKIQEVGDVFTTEEVAKIKLFCTKIGLDYGELDVLRDKKDGKIYIIDCNTTPYGRSYVSDEEWNTYYFILADSFYNSFLKQ